MVNVHLAISLRVRLGGIADADDFAGRQPLVHFLHPVDFVRLRALRQAGQEAGEIHPRGVAQDDGAVRIEGAQEGAQEGVEVVGRGGEVEPCRVEGRVHVLVEGRHVGDWFRGADEGRAQDAGGRGRHGDFDGVVDVCDMAVSGC